MRLTVADESGTGDPTGVFVRVSILAGRVRGDSVEFRDKSGKLIGQVDVWNWAEKEEDENES